MDTLNFIPITQIIKSKFMSRSLIYNQVKEGKIILYKFGKKSFVKKDEFEKAFTKK